MTAKPTIPTMTWRERWSALIWDKLKDLPDDTPLSERVLAVDAVKYNWRRSYATSWGKKSWQAARRDYLCRHGYKPGTRASKQATLPLFDDSLKNGEDTE